MADAKENEFLKLFIGKIRSEVIAKLNPRNISGGKKLSTHGQEYAQIYSMLENTFKLREGKSVMIIGPRGIGKTLLVENALHDLETVKRYTFFTVRLNGSFFKDDTVAIKEIARQLDWYLEKYNPSERENLQRATFEQKTVTNTMNVIIDILDRTRLNETDERVDSKDEKNGTSGTKPSLFVPIVFVIDEIDRYTHSAKQTLLYNLFDMAQSSSSRTEDGGDTKSSGGTTISVIGITTKTTVREQLEKRVKSRFSQRIIQFNKVRDLEEFCRSVYHMVCFTEEECDENEDGYSTCRRQYNELMQKYVFEKGELRRLIVENFYTIKDVNAIRNELIVFIMSDFNRLTYHHLSDYRNRNVEVMRTLSESELKLLISCCRAKILNNVLQINFDMAFDEYSRMILSERRDIQSRIQVVGMSLKDYEGSYLLSRDAMQICWERLCDLGLLERQAVSFYGNSAHLTGQRGRKDDSFTTSTGTGSGQAVRTLSTSALTKGSINTSSSSFSSAAGAITPSGVAVCGVELDDIDPSCLRPIHDADTTPGVSWWWLEHWKRVAQ